MSPEIKLLLQLKKNWLVIKAKELGLNILGSKLILAKRVAAKEEEIYTNLWNSIAKRRT